MKEMPLVSICCTSFNHESYIREALEGFLMQKTTFPVEIIIHDDASTDHTAEVIMEYVKAYPDLIVPILQTRNQYSQGVKIWPNFVFPVAKGKYIALCDGDDYWTDQYKLQKQVDFLESNPEYGLVFTQAKEIEGNSSNTKITGGKVDSFYDLLFANPIPTLTTCFTNSLLQDYLMKIQPENKQWLMGDLPIWLWFVFNSKIGFINETTAHYRVLSESVSHSKSYEKASVFAYSAFDIRKFYLIKFNREQYIQAVKGANFQRLFQMSLQYREFSDSFRLFFKSPVSNLKTFIKYCLGYYTRR